jgi:hypothetical protein
MIQRIQSLYLFVGLVASSLLFFMPFAKFFTGGNAVYEFTMLGMKHVTPDETTVTMIPIFMLSILIIVTILVLAALLMFKDRVKQMRTVAVAFLLNAILIGLIFYFSDKFATEFATTANYKNIGTLLPVLTLLMLLLANKAIKSDEIKMRKSKRIR